MALTRRNFLKWAGATGIGAVVFNGCNVPDDEILVQSPLELPEDLVTGRDNFYATVFQSSSGSEGLRVRVMEGRAKKVEGNPDYPLNTGKHGARSEALLQAVYHPDRIKGPVTTAGIPGRFSPISWDQGISQLTNSLRDADPGSVLIATGPVRGLMADVVKGFAKATGAQLLGFDPLDKTVLRSTMKRLFGQEPLPDFDLANTHYLLGFGADFLSTWLDSTHFMRGYGEFRQGAGRDRGHFVQVDSHMSMTAANADEWVFVNPGMEGLLAMAMAYVIIDEGLGDDDAAGQLTGNQGAEALNNFRPSQVAEATGITAERIEALARAFADTSRGPSLAIGGGSAAAHTNGSFNLQAIYSLNFLVGSVNRPGGLIFNSGTLLSQIAGASIKEWKVALESMRRGDIKVLIVKDADLLHGLPGSLDAAGALANVEIIVSLSSFLDDTSAKASLLLPGHTALEEWGSDTPDPGPGYATVALQQPVVVPFANTRATGDVLLQVVRQLEANDGINADNMRDALRRSMEPLKATNRGSVRRPTFEEFWIRTLQRGGWWDTTDKPSSTIPIAPVLPRNAVMPKFNGKVSSYPYYLVPFEHNSIGAGQAAHLPWLQALPDPVTTVTWGTWVELNPETAKKLDVQMESVVIVESSTGKTIEAPVYVNPAAPPNVIAIPLGQGHQHFGSYASGRGTNPFEILDPVEDEEAGGLAWAATMVRVVKTTRKQRIAAYEGIVPAIQLPDDKIIQVVTKTR